ncbi:MAG TPA: FG-GAP-like repeat-containing protein [Blastocatellia bacterium]|nr:FG-GAP-like repeat-containing protein [Blastocatellia bacterium]
MSTALRLFAAAAVFSFVIIIASLSGSTQNTREEAYRANNIGVALLEQFKYKEGAESFRRALRLDPRLTIARINLSIALYNVPDVPAALREAKAAAEALPASPQAHYMLGLIARSQNRAEDAVAAFQKVLQFDPRDVGANVNIGQVLMQQRKYAEAVANFRTAVEAEPYNVTATYNLALALLRTNQREQGQAMMQRFQTLRDSNYGTVIGTNYLEEGQYAEAIASTGAEPELVETATPEVKFVDATSSVLAPPTDAKPAPGAPSTPLFGRSFKDAAEAIEAMRRALGAATLFDLDDDGDLDLFDSASQKLYRNDGGKLVDITAQSGISKSNLASTGTGAAAGDFDNDGKVDLFVLRYGGNALYHNEGNGRFTDVTTAAGIPDYKFLSTAAAFVDIDHDGDLDIFVAGFIDPSKTSGGAARPVVFPTDFAPAPNMLFRNNGNGKFADVTAAAQVGGPTGRAVAVVPTDYDNRRDIDLLVLSYGDRPTLFGNLRDGSFRNVASDTGLGEGARFTCAAAGDANKDGYTDFFFGVADGPGRFATSDGKGRFVTAPAPATTEAAHAAQFIDYDNDGLLDLVALTAKGVRVLRNVGTGWADVSDKAASSLDGNLSNSFASGDIDGDGDTDLIARSASGDLKIARNEGGSRNSSLRIRLAGKVSNRNGVGTKLEVRAGSLKQKLETYAASPAPAPADVLFGLGKRASADAVRLLWPSGNVQSEIEFPKQASSASALTINEVDRKPSSCPYLYAWNGARFEFITDFLGGGEMGYWVAPGARNHPDPDEYVRIRGDQLRERNGRFEIRVTNELEEALYVDRLQLIEVAHPAGWEVFPDEGLVDPPFKPFKLYATASARPPVAAVDDKGRDVLSRITEMDRQYVEGFALRRIRGYAEGHTLTLDLGSATPERTLLLLTGWTDYAFSSDNVAAHQAGLSMMPPALQVKDARGQWRTVISDIGIPVGRPQTLAVDLTGRFLSASRQVRIVTNMRIYWDQILVDTSGGRTETRLTRLDPLGATLTWRGFSAEVTPDGREPFGYDYDRVSFVSPWKVMSGRYTREGDVTELLSRTDDMFVVSLPGDEIAVSFDASRLRPLPAGWKRTFLLYADGFSKEMDINSASPHHVEPLPFHAMSGYPYAKGESYPTTRAHREYLDRYNTRVVTAPLPELVSPE